MKKAVFLFSIGLTGCAMSPVEMPVNQSDLVFSQVYEAPGIAKEAIYEGSLKWMAENFKSAKSVIEYQNSGDGTVIGNGTINYPCDGFDCVAKASWRVKFTMKIETKDGRFKTDFKNLLIDMPATTSAFGSYPDMEVPIRLQGDLNAVKPQLLKIGKEIAASLSTKSTSW